MDTFLQKFNPIYFWDVDIDKIDSDISKRLVIERVFTLGNLQEIKLVIKFYQLEVVIKTLCSLNYLDQKTLNFVSIIFKTPKSRFRCYRRRQLIKQQWN